ncbi:lipid-A-disaccharide synthase N-terminal domain-containing protein [Winogradskyella litorisediminis]|uniref:Lipid-A-disaccharide synthase N-terminal domain-containing protein n=1 Tax=Winogradskyella litorisediminis TaxID=1156618 RepID=A0ABW3NBS5_9FLAO
MKDWILLSIGFTAQLLFSSRLIVQWLQSEKVKAVVTPKLFWILSLFASFLLFIYGYLRSDFAIMLGQSLTYYIYIRNLQLQNEWKKIKKVFQYFLISFPVFIGIYYFNNNKIDIDILFYNENISAQLLLFGILAQLIFVLRFVYQWLYSEQKKESILPKGFWVLSLIGASLILIYAIIRKDVVLGIGHTAGIFIYARNLFLNSKTK